MANVIGPMDEWACRNAGGTPINGRLAVPYNTSGRANKGGPMIYDCAMPEPKAASVPTSITVNPTITTNVSPQISPVFQQQFQPTNSPATAGTTQATAPATAAPAVDYQAQYAANLERFRLEAELAAAKKAAAAPAPQAPPVMIPTIAQAPAVTSGTMLPVSAPPPSGPVVNTAAPEVLPASGGVTTVDMAPVTVSAPHAAPFDWKIPAIIGAGLLGVMLLGANQKQKRRN